MTETPESKPQPTVDLIAAGQEAVSIVFADPLVFVGAGVLFSAGTLLSSTILGGPLLVGFLRMTEKSLNGKTIDFADLGLGFQKVSGPMLAWLVYVLAVTVCLTAFVLPGLFIAIAWMFAFWFIARDDCLSSDSIKHAWRLFAKAPGACVVIALTVVLVNIVGALTIVGILVSVPVSLVFMTLCFHGLTR
ncbi:MAG: hypothetical protein H7Z43_03150 [Clostridia bacterium]|nr:hypothetical protein [Deltaproteobacteria bacterium]